MRLPPSLLTTEVMHALRTKSNLPANTWYYVAGSTLSTLNRPDEAARVLEHVLNHGPGSESARPSVETQLMMARKMREAMVKLTAITGLPKVSPIDPSL